MSYMKNKESLAIFNKKKKLFLTHDYTPLFPPTLFLCLTFNPINTTVYTQEYAWVRYSSEHLNDVTISTIDVLLECIACISKFEKSFSLFNCFPIVDGIIQINRCSANIFLLFIKQ